MVKTILDRRAFGALAAGLAFAPVSACAAAATESSSVPDLAPDVQSGGDGRGRITLPVHFGDQGPFHFAIDSAANTSVIAADLAERLALPYDGDAWMNSLVGREAVQMIAADQVKVGSIRMDHARLVRGTRLGLGGTDGLVGSDILMGHRLALNFRSQRARLGRARLEDDSVLDVSRPRVRFRSTRLVGGVLRITASTNGQDAHIIIDTGAQVSIINSAMAGIAEARALTLSDGSTERMISSPTGRSAMAKVMMLPSLNFGGAHLSHLPVLAGDFHAFDVWGLSDQPAMLLGVDVMARFTQIVLDLKRGELILER